MWKVAELIWINDTQLKIENATVTLFTKPYPATKKEGNMELKGHFAEGKTKEGVYLLFWPDTEINLEWDECLFKLIHKYFEV
jgi:hypothetical protein